MDTDISTKHRYVAHVPAESITLCSQVGFPELIYPVSLHLITYLLRECYIIVTEEVKK